MRLKAGDGDKIWIKISSNLGRIPEGRIQEQMCVGYIRYGGCCH